MRYQTLLHLFNRESLVGKDAIPGEDDVAVLP